MLNSDLHSMLREQGQGVELSPRLVILAFHSRESLHEADNGIGCFDSGELFYTMRKIRC